MFDPQKQNDLWWNNAAVHNRDDQLNMLLEEAAEVCSLGYLFALNRHWQQELIWRICGSQGHRGFDRTFSLRTTEGKTKRDGGQARLKSIGKGVEITDLRHRALDLSKPKTLTDRLAINVFYEYGPFAEDIAKRGIIEEADV